MVVINLKGGLGNQLFQYASALSFASHRKQELAFDIQSFEDDPYNRTFALTPFDIHHKTLSTEEVNSFLKLDPFERILNYLRSAKNKRYYSLGDLEYSPSIFKSKAQNQYLNGYFANPSYFVSIRQKLLKRITLKDKYRTSAFSNKLEWIKKNTFVSVHIRRTDYLKDANANQLFATLNRDYYDRCINYFTSRNSNSPKFLFFSDDIDWAKTEFSHIEGANFMDDEQLYKDYYDLMFMAACEHNIIANSTFSWWGAWLNDNPEKIVLAPKTWYKNRTYQDFYERESFLPKNWIKI